MFGVQYPVIANYTGRVHFIYEAHHTGTADTFRGSVIECPALHLPAVHLDIVYDPALRSFAYPCNALLKRGPSCTGADKQPIFVADNDLRIRAYINEDRNLVRLEHTRDYYAGNNIPAYITPGIRKDINKRLRVYIDPELRRIKESRFFNLRHKRRDRYTADIETKEKMAHGRIPCSNKRVDLLPADARVIT